LIPIDQLSIDIDQILIDVNRLLIGIDQLSIDVNQLSIGIDQLLIDIDQLLIDIDQNGPHSGSDEDADLLQLPQLIPYFRRLLEFDVLRGHEFGANR
jgi:hypothetical protein